MTDATKIDGLLFLDGALPKLPPSQRQPVLLLASDAIGMKEAEDLTGRNSKTIKRWCRLYSIGHQSCRNAEWEISGPALMMVRHGYVTELELLRNDQRSHPRVQRLIDHFGFPG